MPGLASITDQFAAGPKNARKKTKSVGASNLAGKQNKTFWCCLGVASPWLIPEHKNDILFPFLPSFLLPLFIEILLATTVIADQGWLISYLQNGPNCILLCQLIDPNFSVERLSTSDYVYVNLYRNQWDILRKCHRSTLVTLSVLFVPRQFQATAG